jgi:DNA-binding transcriptional ArsR family regulator
MITVEHARVGVLENPTYVEILLCLINGKNYAMAIARTLKKRQPTVTEQLKELERVGLIKALKRRKAQYYEVNWDLLFDIFYKVANGILELREEYFSKKELALIKRTNLQGLIPKDLLDGFLREYFAAYESIGGKTKGFDEIIYSFFGAISRLDKPRLRKLTARFRIDEKTLSAIALVVGFELYGTELVALQFFVDKKAH